MTQHTSTARSFTLPFTGVVFDDRTTGERAEVTAQGQALYRLNSHSPEELVTVTRGRALAWALRVREALDSGAQGFLFGGLGLTLEKELSFGQAGLFALPQYKPADDLAQAAD
ncbi:hypothetical protein [Deinococcus peraridilitoris]|uniref:Uncharacterized protein n=1 Tax=Deinococcus peraridilitoris (strain DSM 19664 / LMG 22246 / CIP 109416 / KR-200) TaxID=937777 RepID=L0A227_DEIPD|nr:hypothetical protein [Deinococcus peraridilitoris]AFZ67901.1 hypothetical protein Deipe_2427 [Deinococcus peraridilitoris DSM 19664]